MPTLIDFDATVDQVFSSVVTLATFEEEVTLVAYQVSEDVDTLFESIEYEDDGKEIIHAAVRKMSVAIKNKLLTLNAYSEQGHLPYTFRKLLDANSVVLSKVPSAAPAPYEPRF